MWKHFNFHYQTNDISPETVPATTEYRTIIETYPNGKTYRVYSDGTTEIVDVNGDE